MNALNLHEPHEPRLACWLRHAAVGVVGLVAVLSVVLSFAVEFMATEDLQRRAHGLQARQAPPLVDVSGGSERPSRPAH